MPRTLGVLFIIMESEIWKDVVGYEGLYQVSNLGRVMNIRKNKLASLVLNTNGYYRVNVSKNKTWKLMYVHRLVAEAFVEKIEGKTQIDHIDGDRMNNRATNLRWCTQKENANFPIAKERRSESHKGKVGILNPMYGKKRPIEVVNKMAHSMALKYNMPVIQYTKDGKFVKEWICAAVAEKYIGVNQNHIRDCCRGKVKSAGGYIWKFIKD